MVFVCFSRSYYSLFPSVILSMFMRAGKCYGWECRCIFSHLSASSLLPLYFLRSYYFFLSLFSSALAVHLHPLPGPRCCEIRCRRMRLRTHRIGIPLGGG